MLNVVVVVMVVELVSQLAVVTLFASKLLINDVEVPAEDVIGALVVIAGLCVDKMA
jgi:hypothetical protein